MQKNTTFIDKVQAYPCAQPCPWANLMHLTAAGVVVNSYATATMTKKTTWMLDFTPGGHQAAQLDTTA